MKVDKVTVSICEKTFVPLYSATVTISEDFFDDLMWYSQDLRDDVVKSLGLELVETFKPDNPRYDDFTSLSTERRLIKELDIS